MFLFSCVGIQWTLEDTSAVPLLGGLIDHLFSFLCWEDPESPLQPVWNSHRGFPWHQWVFWHILKAFIFTGVGSGLLGRIKIGIELQGAPVSVSSQSGSKEFKTIHIQMSLYGSVLLTFFPSLENLGSDTTVGMLHTFHLSCVVWGWYYRPRFTDVGTVTPTSVVRKQFRWYCDQVSGFKS